MPKYIANYCSVLVSQIEITRREEVRLLPKRVTSGAEERKMRLQAENPLPIISTARRER